MMDTILSENKDNSGMAVVENDKVNFDTENLSLRDLVNLANKYINKEINDAQFQVYLMKMPVRFYIPLIEKVDLTIGIVRSIVNMNSALYELTVAEMYKLLFFKVLLGVYAMVDVSDISLTTYENYDLLYPMFSGYILKNCETDYKIFEDIVNRTLSVYNFHNFLDTIGSISENGLVEAVKENQKIIEELKNNSDTIKELNKLFEYNDPATKAIVDGLDSIAIEEARANKKEISTSKRRARTKKS